MRYMVKDLECVKNNQEAYIKECNIAHNKFLKYYGQNKDSTFSYSKYNLFVLHPNPLFYDLYKEICKAAREYVGDDRRLWMQSWINFHNHYEVLDWHHHEFPFHGYISIDPKKTKTLFNDWLAEDATLENWEIENAPGRFYLGAGEIMHKVETLEPFEGKRITIGVDFTTGNLEQATSKLIPVL